MNARSQSFQAECFLKHPTSSTRFLWCILLKSRLRVIEGGLFSRWDSWDKTAFSLAPWSSSDTNTSTVCTFSCEQGPTWFLWWICVTIDPLYNEIRLVTFICESWMLVNLLLVHWLSMREEWLRSPKELLFLRCADPANTMWSLLNWLKSSNWWFFSASKTSVSRTDCSLAKIFNATNRCPINVIHFTCCCLYIVADGCI